MIRTQTFVTRLPDRHGALLLASGIIKARNGDITRVSYNKSVDLNTVFLEVRGEEADLAAIRQALSEIGYLEEDLPPAQVIMLNIRHAAGVGTIYPILQILNRHQVNISYINGQEQSAESAMLRLGLLIEDPSQIKQILDEISALYPVDIEDYNLTENPLDNTVFYIRIASEIQKLFDLSNEKTIEFMSESSRVLETVQKLGEDPRKVFEYIRDFAYKLARYRGAGFNPFITQYDLTGQTRLHVIEPPLGSNTYILENGRQLLLMDSGFALYANEMLQVLHTLFPDFDKREKIMMITHADVDHCGLLSVIKDARIVLNLKSAQGFIRQRDNLTDYREKNIDHLGYSRLSRIFSCYEPPEESRFEIFGAQAPEQHEEMLLIHRFTFGDLEFEVYEGSGGHLYGELIYICRNPRLAFTGDVFLNTKGFSDRLKEFLALAPYMMSSVNVDPPRAKEMLQATRRMLTELGPGTLVCTGHGAVEVQSYPLPYSKESPAASLPTKGKNNES